MKVYSVHLSHLTNNLDMPYGIFSTEEKALAKAKAYPLNITDPELAGLNVTITEHELDTEMEKVIYSWILRENGEYTPETDEDLDNAVREIIAKAEENGQISRLFIEEQKGEFK